MYRERDTHMLYECIYVYLCACELRVYAVNFGLWGWFANSPDKLQTKEYNRQEKEPPWIYYG